MFARDLARRARRTAAWTAAVLGCVVAVAAWRNRAVVRYTGVGTALAHVTVDVTPRHVIVWHWRTATDEGVWEPIVYARYGLLVISAVEPRERDEEENDDFYDEADGSARWHRFGLAWSDRQARLPSFTLVEVPTGFVLAASATPLALMAGRRWRDRRRRRAGRCPACGYDLRASPARCPECGTVVTPAARSSAP